MSDQMSDTRIQVHFDIHQPIELVELTLSLQAIANEYHAMLSKRAAAEGAKADPNGVKLYITKIESNCILAEFGGAVSVMGQFFSLMDYSNIFTEFVRNTSEQIRYFIGLYRQDKIDQASIQCSKRQADRFAQIASVVAQNKEGNLRLRAIRLSEKDGDRETLLEATFNSEEMYEAREGALLAKSALEVRERADLESVLMHFYQTNTDDPKTDGRTGDRAVIARVTDKPLRVYVIPEMDKQKIRHILDDPHTNPLRVSFVVDVNVERDRRGAPLMYRVVRVHETIIDTAESGDLIGKVEQT